MTTEANTAMAKRGSKEQREIERLAQIFNDAVPDGTDGGLVLGALMFLTRIGFMNHIEDPQKRLEVYDELVAGNRALMMTDAGIKSQ